jgi:hypothetical protein
LSVPRIQKIISGGQTGADRAALVFAIERGIPHGGWCPKGRKAEDGPIDARYQLKETPSAGYVQRTEWNARDSDATVVFSIGQVLTGGSKKTVELAQKHKKPVLHLSKANGVSDAEAALRRFIEEHNIRVLNVAGPKGVSLDQHGGFCPDQCVNDGLGTAAMGRKVNTPLGLAGAGVRTPAGWGAQRQ